MRFLSRICVITRVTLLAKGILGIFCYNFHKEYKHKEIILKNNNEIPEPDEFPEVPDEYPSNPEPYEPDDPGLPEPEPSEPNEPDLE